MITADRKHDRRTACDGGMRGRTLRLMSMPLAC
jgi:hypothetical protein